MNKNTTRIVLTGVVSSLVLSTEGKASKIGYINYSKDYSYPVTSKLHDYEQEENKSKEELFISSLYEESDNSSELNNELEIVDADDSYKTNDEYEISYASTTEEQVVLSDKVRDAMVRYAPELKNSIERKISNDLFMTITKDEIDGNQVYISHLIVNNPNKMEKIVANGCYNNGREKVSSMASKVEAVWAINGSHYDTGGSTQDYRNNPITIVDGKIVHDGGNSVGMEICYTKDGHWFSAPYGATAHDLINMNVVETYSSIQMRILEEGEVCEPQNYLEVEEMNKSYNRTIIGQTLTGEIYVLTGETKTKSAAEYLKNKGCYWAKSMDMGGSVTLYANGKVINQPTDDTGEREVIDCVSVLK